MGDINAKIREDNTRYKEVMRRNGLESMIANRERLANLCPMNKLVIVGSVFLHRRIHKATWVSPDHVIENQIDHICIAKGFRRSLQDVRLQRGADAASDHPLLIAKLKVKLKENTAEVRPKS